MLNGGLSITRGEHRFFFLTTSIGLLVRLIELVIAALLYAPKEGESFGIYSIFDVWEVISPLYSIAAFLLILPFLTKIRLTPLAVSAVPLALLTFFFDRWFLRTQFDVQYAAKVNPDFPFKTWDHLLFGGSIFDVLTFFIVNILIIWQASVIFRLIRNQPQ